MFIGKKKKKNYKDKTRMLIPPSFNTHLKVLMNGMEWKGRERKRREGKGKEGKGREGVYKFINSGQAVAVLLFIDYRLEKFKWINKNAF